MVKLEDYKTGQIHTIFGPEIQEVGAFKPHTNPTQLDILGSWKMKLRTGERFVASGGITVYSELVMILIKRAIEKGIR